MAKVTATELRVAASDLLDHVARHGERIAVERHGKPVAALVNPEYLELLKVIEDRMDIEAARKAMREPAARELARGEGRARSASTRALIAP